jgi:hypothetical protein
MKTYLSVDVDFWCDAEQARQQLHLLLKSRSLRRITTACMNHQQMLREVNASGARRLRNIDAHSDLAEQNVEVLNCGTWVSYVSWRKEGEYIWVRPDRNFNGSCNGHSGTWNNDTDWKRSRSRYISNTKLDITDYLDECVGIGICMSPAYAPNEVQQVFRDLVGEYNIPYRKGLMSENQRRKSLPPSINHNARGLWHGSLYG